MIRSFGREKWYEIANLYDNVLEAHGSASVRQLAKVTRVFGRSAETSMYYYEIGLVVPP